jgi:hypothetical protein
VLGLYIIGEGVSILWNDIIVLALYLCVQSLDCVAALSNPVAIDCSNRRRKNEFFGSEFDSIINGRESSILDTNVPP